MGLTHTLRAICFPPIWSTIWSVHDTRESPQETCAKPAVYFGHSHITDWKSYKWNVSDLYRYSRFNPFSKIFLPLFDSGRNARRKPKTIHRLLKIFRPTVGKDGTMGWIWTHSHPEYYLSNSQMNALYSAKFNDAGHCGIKTLAFTCERLAVFIWPQMPYQWTCYVYTLGLWMPYIFC